MDIRLTVDYVDFENESPSIITRNGHPAIEATGGGTIEISLDNVDSDDVEKFVRQAYEDASSTSDFLDMLDSSQRDQINDYYYDRFNEDRDDYFDADTVIDRLDSEYSTWKDVGRKLATRNSQETELESLLEGIGIDRIKKILDIKLVIYNEQPAPVPEIQAISV